MKKIKIKCRLNNSINYYKYQAIIYNYLGNKVFDNLSDENGILIFDAPYYGVYRILIVKNKNVKFCTNIIVLENEDNYYYFNIPNMKKTTHLVTLKVTDEYYKGLPIKEGKITLWQKNI